MKNYLLLICAISLIGCAPKKPVVEDPCAKAPVICWGKIGVSPSDTEACGALISCHDWKMEAL